MSRVNVFRMIKRRVKVVGLGEANCHTIRATGITAYLLNGGTLERAQRIAAHESPRTTKLYDRTADNRLVPQRAGCVTRRAGAEDGVAVEAVDTPGSWRLSGLFWGWVLPGR